jgi:uncharacterized protein (TIGR02246 family)
MVRIGGLALMAAVAACSGGTPPADTSDATDRRAIADLVATENAGFTSGNVGQLLDLYMDDVVVMPPGEPAVRGREALRVWLERQFTQSKIGSSTVSEDLQIHGDWAVERLTRHSTITPAAGGAAVSETGRSVHVYRRRPDGMWRIAQDIWTSDTNATPAPAPAAAVSTLDAGPVAPATSPAPAGVDPFSTATVTGRMPSASIAADVMAYNQDARGWSAFRTPGVITRWELPVRIYVEPAVNADNVQRAMAEWQLLAGISYSFIRADAAPRILVRAGSDGLSGTAVARGGIDGTEVNNRAKSGLVVISPDLARCDMADAKCAALFGRVMASALGVLDRVPGGITSGAPEPSPREINLIRALYQLPHGAMVKPDGSWAVVK